METFLTLTSIKMQWQTIHYMVWGLQELIFASSLTTKEPLVTYNAMPKDTTCFGWRIVVE
jgi:hypothetical protein